MSEYGASVAGGSEIVNYYMSGDYDNEQGVLDFNKDKKVSARANVGARVSDKVSLNVNSSYTRNNLALNANAVERYLPQ